MRNRLANQLVGHFYLRTAGFVLFVILAVIWELVSRLAIVNPTFLPPASKIAVTFFSLIFSLELVEAGAITLGRCFGGYLIAAAAAIPIGILMGRSGKLYVVFEPIIESLRPIPSAAVIPIAILFLGIEDEMKIAVVVFGSIWPILLNTIHGVQTIDPVIVDTGRTFNLSGRQFLLRVTLPAAAPSIATGLRISLAISFILAITVEMIAGSSGLGFLILDFERSFRYPEMYSGILFLGLIGLMINLVLGFLDRRYLAWARLSYTV